MVNSKSKGGIDNIRNVSLSIGIPLVAGNTI